MDTLIVYDNSGKIFYMASGDYIEPTGGLQYIIAYVPEDKCIVSVDTSVKNEHKVILKDLEVPETNKLKSKVEEQEAALIELADLIATLMA